MSTVATTRQTVGERIRERRRELHIKQEALAAETGMSQSTLSRIELGEQLPDSYQMKRLAAALMIDLPWA